jgi:hypothetical protein
MVITLPVLISAFALVVSIGSAILAFRADNRAVRSVRPYISTGVHIAPNDMSVSLSNYGAGVAIVTQVSISRGGERPQRSLLPLLTASDGYDLQPGVEFVQKEYYLRPGDELPLAGAAIVSNRDPGKALKDWVETLDGIDIAVEYKDILGHPFRYTRTISTRGI